MQRSTFIVGMVLIVSLFYLNACAPSTERIAGQTATAEQRAVKATVYTARSTAQSWTPTPSPGILYDEAVMHCNDAFEKALSDETSVIESASILSLTIREWLAEEGHDPGCPRGLPVGDVL